MKNALILHGTDGNSQENWFPWLKKELEREHYKVWVPNLPRADKPNIIRYNEFLIPKWNVDKDSIIIGHSSGSVAALGFLQSLPEGMIIKHTYLVAGFTNNDLGWDSLTELFTTPLHWDTIRAKARAFTLFHSDNDPYVPLSEGKFLEQKLNAELVLLPGQDHFSLGHDPRFSQFPELLEKIIR